MHQSVGDLCEQPSVDVITDMMSTVFDQMYSVMECQEPGTTHSDKLPLACKYKFPKELHILILIKLTNCYLLNLNLVLSATFSNISAISWRPVLLVEEAGVPGENHRP
jgi:hypothetical protein